MSAPTPFECFAAGMFHGLMDGSNGRTVRSYGEGEIHAEFRGWLDEREAEANALAEAATERILAVDSVGRILACGNRNPEAWTINSVHSGVTIGSPSALIHTECGYGCFADAEGMVDVVTEAPR